MNAPDSAIVPETRRSRRWLVWTASLAAAALGVVYGFQVGQRVAGLWLGVVMALNAGALGALVVGSLVDRFLRRFGPGRDRA
jgi:hypothetical protein